MSSPAASVARAKERRPDEYCRAPRCLWYLGSPNTGWCPRHAPANAPAPLPQAARTAPGRARPPVWPDADLERDLHAEARTEWAWEEQELDELERDAEDARGGEAINE